MEEQQQSNPFLQQENYFSGYDESILEHRNNPEVVAFEKLCYETFEGSEFGKKFLEFAKFRFLINSQIQRGTRTYKTDVIWQEGFRDAYRMILQCVQSHHQRIIAGAK